MHKLILILLIYLPLVFSKPINKRKQIVNKNQVILQNNNNEQSNKTKQKKNIPSSWKIITKSINIGPEASVKRVLFNICDGAINVSSSEIGDEGGIRYSSKNEPIFTFIQKIARLAKWRLVILEDGSIIVKPDKPYWHNHQAPFMSNKRTSASKTSSGNDSESSMNKLESTRDLWSELNDALNSLKQTGDIKEFHILPQGGIISVCAPQEMHIKINQLIKELQYNTGTQIHLSMKILGTDVESKEKSLIVNFMSFKPISEYFYGLIERIFYRENAERLQLGQQIEQLQHEATANFQAIRRIGQSQPQSVAHPSASHDLSLIPRTGEPPKILKKLLASINLGQTETLCEYEGVFSNNEGITASVTETQSVMTPESVIIPGISGMAGAGINGITKTILTKTYPIGLSVHITGSAENNNCVVLAVKVCISEISNSVVKSVDGASSGRDQINETSQNMLDTVLRIENDKLTIIGGFLKDKKNPGMVGLNKGELTVTLPDGKKQQIHILLKTRVIRPEEFYNSCASLKKYELEEIPEENWHDAYSEKQAEHNHEIKQDRQEAKLPVSPDNSKSQIV